MSEPAPRCQPMAQRLLRYEEPDDPRRVVAAAVGFLEELAPVLENLVGPAGRRAIEGRAFRMARTAHPILERVKTGHVADGVVKGLSTLTPGARAKDLAPAAIDLVAHLIELLASLLGEPVALRMLRRVRPDLQMDGADLRMDHTHLIDGPGKVE